MRLCDWYFTRCVRASSRSSYTYLSVLSAIDGAEHDIDSAAIAIAELRRVDVWMKGYALPAVLRASRMASATQALHDATQEYFVDVAGHLPAELQPSAISLAGALRDDAATLRQAIEKYATKLAPSDQPLASTNPYLDLPDFLAEIVWLSILAEWLERDTGRAGVMHQDLYQNDGATRDVMKAAVAGRFGRVGELLAIRIMAAGGEQRQDALATVFERFGNFALEPDLLTAWVESGMPMAYRGSRMSVNEMIDESMLFRAFDGTLSPPDAVQVASSELLGRSRVPVRPDAADPFAKALWQCVLWETAARRDAEVATSRLAELWEIPSPLPADGAVNLSGPIGNWRHWAQRVQSLVESRTPELSQRRSDDKANWLRPRLQASRATAFQSNSGNWLIGSPWLSISRRESSLREDNPNRPRYPAVVSPALLFRLSAAATTAVHLLRNAGDAPRLDAIAAFCLHAYDVLRSSGVSTDTIHDDLDVDVENYAQRYCYTLSLVAFDQLRTIGGGLEEVVGPDLFLSAARDGPTAPANDNGRTAVGESAPSADASLFRHVVAPSVMLDWISRSCESASRGNPAARWLPHIEALRDSLSLDHDARLLDAELIDRFVAPGGGVPGTRTHGVDPFDVDANTDPRRILLADAGYAEDWQAALERNPGIDTPEQIQRRVNLLTEYLARTKPEDFESAERQALRAEWMQRVSVLSEVMPLDQRFRLRLVELFEAEAIAAFEDGQHAIADLILEHGRALDRQRLFDAMYPLTEAGWAIEVTDARHLVRQALLGPIVRLAKAPTDDGDATADLPRRRVARRRAVEQARGTLRRIAFFNRLGSAIPEQRKLARQLAAAFDAAAERLADTGRLLEAQVDAIGTSFSAPIAAACEPLLGVGIRTQAFDPNEMSTSAFVESRRSREAINFFDKTSAELASFVDELRKDSQRARRGERKPIWALGVIAADGDDQKIRVNCGLNEFIEAKRGTRALRLGTFVRVPLQYQPDDGSPDGRLRFDQREYVQPLHEARRTGDVSIVTLFEPGGEAGEIRLLLEDGSGKRLDSDLWDADISRRFFSPAEPERLLGSKTAKKPQRDRRICARWTGDQWEPVERELTQLLLEIGAGDDGQLTVMTLINYTEDGLWRLARRRGDNYLIHPTDFRGGDSDELSALVADYDSSTGLLIVVRAILEDGEPRLSLLREPARDARLLARYPDLNCPVDDRNIRWRELFATQRTRTLSFEKESWVLDLSSELIPGFPTWIAAVALDGHCPRGNQAEVRVGEWRFRQREITATFIEFDGIRLPDDAELAAFYDRWSALRAGDVVTLAFADRMDVEQAAVVCSTSERFAVSIDRESLSMLPREDDWIRARIEKRSAQVTSVAVGASQRIDADLDALTRALPLLSDVNGILVRLPKAGSSDSNIYSVLWRTANGCVQTRLNVRSTTRALRLGARLSFRAATREVRAMNVDVYARALWRIAPSVPPDGSLYLGSCIVDGRTRAIVEGDPGIVHLIEEPNLAPRHLAKLQGKSYLDGLPATWQPTSWSAGQVRSESRTRRVSLRLKDAYYGDADARMLSKQVSVSSIIIRASRVDAERLAISRVFKLQAVKWLTTAPRTAKTQRQSAEQAWRAFLDGRIATGDPVSCTRTENGELRPTAGDGGQAPRERCPFTIPILADEGAWFADGEYGDDCVAVLLRGNDNAPVASFRRIRAWTLSEFRRSCDRSTEERDGATRLEFPLYYLGPDDGAPENNQIHRFEWGYGKSLLIAEDDVRFDEKVFSSAKHLIYFGDRVVEVAFPVADIDTSGDGEIAYLMSIKATEISNARVLLSQRRDHRIIHVLRVSRMRRPNGRYDLRISAVIGFASTSQDEQADFRVSYARLDVNSEVRILARLESAPASDAAEPEITIFGRLIESAFEQRRGRDVVFQHVRMTFDVQPDGTELGAPDRRGRRMGERVFVRAGTIEPARNDAKLSIRAYAEIAPEDVGADCSNLVILKREFSMREDVLPRLLRQDPSALQENILLVMLEPGVKVRASLSKNAPARRASVLRRSGKSAQFATVADWNDKRVQLEISPGVFVSVGVEAIDAVRPLSERTIVRVTPLDGERFQIVPAMFNDRLYITDRRAVVGLPKNSTLKAASLGRPGTMFTIGGLPDIEAEHGSYDAKGDRRRTGEAAEFAAIMARPHPKMVWVGLAGQEARYVDASGADTVGRLEISKTLDVSLVQLSDSERVAAVSWPHLSFSDANARSIAQTVRGEKWSYHDNMSGQIVLGELVWGSIDDEDGSTGPLVFESAGGEYRLRYSKRRLREYGFPARELFRSLESSARRTNTRHRDFTVITPVTDGEGVWIELAPGRVVEIPAALVVQMRGTREVSLGDFDWSQLATGDRLTLGLSSADPLQTERVQLLAWRPGPRNALGPDRALLPVVSVDDDGIGSVLGAGDFQLTIPRRWDDEPPKLVSLLSDGSTAGISGGWHLSPGECILLTVEGGRLAVAGFPSLKPLPSNTPVLWVGDVLAEYFVDGLPSQRARRIAAVIEAAGGALPVTVEALHGQALYYSRRHQAPLSNVLPGTASVGVISGLIEAHTVLLRRGGGLVPVPSMGVIAGLPANMLAAAIATLRRCAHPIWFTSRDDRIELSLGDDRTREFDVLPVAYLGSIRAPHEAAGIICQSVASSRLYWLPAPEIGWTSLSIEELAVVFGTSIENGGTPKPFAVSVTEQLTVSIVARARVLKEFDDSRLGREMLIHVIRQRDATALGQRYLAKSRSTGTTLELIADSPQEEGDQLAAEVSRRSRGTPPLLQATQLNGRRFDLDVPAELCQSYATSGPRSEFVGFLNQDRLRSRINPAYFEQHQEEINDEIAATLLLEGWHQIRGERFFPDTPLWGLLAAENWVARHAGDTLFDLHFALMSILLLHAAPQGSAARPRCVAMAIALAREVGIRAVRSMHIEVLARHRARFQVKAPFGFSSRIDAALGDLMTAMTSPQRLSASDVYRLRHLVRAADLQSREWNSGFNAALIDAMRRCVGELRQATHIAAEAPTTRKLVDIWHSIPIARGRANERMLFSQLRALREILHGVIADGLDLRLPPPVRFVSQQGPESVNVKTPSLISTERRQQVSRRT